MTELLLTNDQRWSAIKALRNYCMINRVGLTMKHELMQKMFNAQIVDGFAYIRLDNDEQAKLFENAIEQCCINKRDKQRMLNKLKEAKQ